MCLLIDANVAHCFEHQKSKDATGAALVRDWIEAKAGRFVTGGRNYSELTNHAWMRRWFLTLGRAGLIKRVSDADVNTEEQRLVKLMVCESDDPHVIALARKSGARILYSRDQALHQDFLNKTLIDDPRGCVFQVAKHKHLLSDKRSGAVQP